MSNSNIPDNQGNNTYKNVVSISGKIEPNDSLTGSVTINSYAYAKNQKQQISKITSAFIKYFAAGDSTMMIKNIEVAGGDINSIPLRQKFDFLLPLSSQEQSNFTLNLFRDLIKIHFRIQIELPTLISIITGRTF